MMKRCNNNIISFDKDIIYTNTDSQNITIYKNYLYYIHNCIYDFNNFNNSSFTIKTNYNNTF
jgi:hypothetical protein